MLVSSNSIRRAQCAALRLQIGIRLYRYHLLGPETWTCYVTSINLPEYASFGSSWPITLSPPRDPRRPRASQCPRISAHMVLFSGTLWHEAFIRACKTCPRAVLRRSPRPTDQQPCASPQLPPLPRSRRSPRTRGRPTSCHTPPVQTIRRRSWPHSSRATTRRTRRSCSKKARPTISSRRSTSQSLRTVRLPLRSSLLNAHKVRSRGRDRRQPHVPEQHHRCPERRQHVGAFSAARSLASSPRV
jgi:hypothetical protein